MTTSATVPPSFAAREHCAQCLESGDIFRATSSPCPGSFNKRFRSRQARSNLIPLGHRMEANHVAFRILSKGEETVFTDGCFFLA